MILSGRSIKSDVIRKFSKFVTPWKATFSLRLRILHRFAVIEFLGRRFDYILPEKIKR